MRKIVIFKKIAFFIHKIRCGWLWFLKTNGFFHRESGVCNFLLFYKNYKKKTKIEPVRKRIVSIANKTYLVKSSYLLEIESSKDN